VIPTVASGAINDLLCSCMFNGLRPIAFLPRVRWRYRILFRRTFLGWLASSAVFVLPIIVPFTAAAASAQSSVVDRTIGDAVVVLSGSWKFHPGDNMAWASPDFDDSGWGSQDLTPPKGSYDPITGSSGFVPGWTAQGYPKLTGYAWYRLHIRLRNTSSSAGMTPLALTMPINFDDAYQVFVNGEQVAQFGRFDTRSVVYYNAQPRSFALPVGTGNGVLTIAIRTWMDSSTPLVSEDAGGLHGPPLVGESSAIDAMLRLEWDAVNRSEIGNLLASASLLLALLLGFTLYWLDHNEPVYLLLGAACSAGFVLRSMVMMGYYSTILPMVTETFLTDVVLTPLTLGLWTLFWAYWFKLERIRTITRISFALTVLLAIGASTVRPPMYGKVVPAEAAIWLLPVVLVLKLLLGALLLWVTYRGIRKRTADGWLALAPILLTIVWAYQEELGVLHVPVILRVYGLTFSMGVLASLLMLTIISVLMMHRFIRGQRESVQLRLEIEQARQVQSVLIPEALPEISGYAMTSVYRPAREVGGDFFQVLPLEGEDANSTLILLGDVSGKGLKAAMTVSLIVGTVRTLAETTSSPAEVLSGLNRRLYGRLQGRFATCLVLRLDGDGDCVLASAGHPSPYLNGKEVVLPGALPLGLNASTCYEEISLKLHVSDHLALYTDGLLEARNASGEIFSFDRLKELFADKPNAAEATGAAVDFGQDDDITVLTLTRLGAGEQSTTQLTAPLLASSPA
jgi:hypothetical protein